MNVLFTSHQATLADLPNFTGTVVRELYRYVADLDLLVCGPQYWFYYGMNGLPSASGSPPQIDGGTRFTLEVALPVQGNIPTAVLPFFKRIEAFRCLSSRYEGSWDGLPEEYGRMIRYIKDNGLKMNGMYAESFLHIDFDHPAAQITDLQIGLLQ